jgi:hypothetical protein
MKKALLWIAAGGAAVGLFFLGKRTDAAPLLPSTPAPPQTYGETTRVSLAVPAGWRRVTSAEVAALPELGSHAGALVNSSGFTSMQYGSLAPFLGSDGRTYATWIEQHYHEPGGATKPWGLHHGVTLLAQTTGALSDEWRIR